MIFCKVEINLENKIMLNNYDVFSYNFSLDNDVEYSSILAK